MWLSFVTKSNSLLLLGTWGLRVYQGIKLLVET